MTKTMTKRSSYLQELGSLMDEINGTSVSKKAEDGSVDPGTMVGKTTHPSRKLDGDSMEATEGSRSHENEEDIKKDVPLGGGHPGGDSSEQNMPQEGTKKTLTGEDPSTEDSYGDRGEDADTTHPANIDFGEKYSSYSFDRCAKEACDDINSFLALVAGGDEPEAKVVKAAEDDSKTKAAAAGYAAGADAAAQYNFDKQAAAQLVTEFRLAGQRDADLVGAYMYKAASEQDEMMAAQMEGAPQGGDDQMDEGAGDPAMAGAGGGEEGGMGGHPMDGMAGAEEGAPEEGGGEEGGAGHEQAVQEMANALIEMGITPEQLMQMIQEHAQGGAKAASVKELPVAAADELYKMAYLMNGFFKAGKIRPAQAKTKEARAAREEFKEYVGYIRDVLGR